MVGRLRETVDALDEIEISILHFLCSTDRPPTLPHLVDSLSATALTTALAIECSCAEGAGTPMEPAYEVPLLVKHYLHFGVRQPCGRSFGTGAAIPFPNRTESVL